MDNRVFPRRRLISLIPGRGIGILVLLAVGGCGSKDSSQQPDEPPGIAEAELGEKVDGRSDRRAEDERGGARKARGKESEKTGRRPRNKAQLRKWVSEHLYMKLAIDELKLPEEQLTRLADMNWRHFAALQKKKAERSPLNEEILKMLSTGVLDEQAFEKDRAWIAEHEALREGQYREMMTTLHETLTAKQRTKIVRFVEAEQNARYAKKDERLATKGKITPPVGCGGQGDSFLSRLTRGG